MSKIYISLIVAILVIQIIFSFFYSSSIITQNNQLNENQQKYDQIKLENELLEKQIADLSSINQLKNSSDSANLQFIQKNIDLKR